MKNKNEMARRASILILYTGGTIGMKTDEVSGALVPFDFSSIYEEFPSLRRLNVEIEVRTMERIIDSSDVTPAEWGALAQLIESNYDKFDGFVVLHGTDTMSYTASALSFMLENLRKPVVFTGSQIPIGVLRTDGRENLITAIEIAGAYTPQGEVCVPEVSLYFQNRLFRANRTTKWSANELNAFHSPNYAPLAEVGVEITYNMHNIRRIDPEVEAELKVTTQMSDGVAIIKIFPAMSFSMLEQMLACEGLRGVILQTYGAGNAPTDPRFIEIIQGAVSRGIIVLNISQCVNGRVEMSLYQTGLGLERAGVVCGFDMTIEAASTKMSYILARHSDIESAKSEIMLNLRGELSR